MLYILFYFILPVCLLYLIIYFATRHAISNANCDKEMQKTQDPNTYKISLLVKLRDLNIIDNIELEKLIAHYDKSFRKDEKDEKLSEYVALLKEIQQNDVINLENYDSRIVELQVKLKDNI